MSAGSTKGGATGGTTAQPNIFSQAANAYTNALGATGTAAGLAAGAGGYDPTKAVGTGYTAATGAPAATVAHPSDILAGIQKYMNPYTEDVVTATQNDVLRQTQMQQEQNAAGAVAAGAFGGSRHGLVEAQTNEAAQRTIADTTASLRAKGFDTAAGLSGADIANKIGVGEFNAGSTNTASLADQVAKNQAGAFGATAANAASSQNAATGTDAASYAARLPLLISQQLQSLGGQAGDLAGQGLSMGQSINNANAQAGGQQQNLIQQIINSAQGMFGNFTGSPGAAVGQVGAAAGGSPLNNATTTTEQYKPGLFDYLSLAAQTVGSTYNPQGAGGGGKGGKGGSAAVA